MNRLIRLQGCNTFQFLELITFVWSYVYPKSLSELDYCICCELLSMPQCIGYNTLLFFFLLYFLLLLLRGNISLFLSDFFYYFMYAFIVFVMKVTLCVCLFLLSEMCWISPNFVSNILSHQRCDITTNKFLIKIANSIATCVGFLLLNLFLSTFW